MSARVAAADRKSSSAATEWQPIGEAFLVILSNVASQRDAAVRIPPAASTSR